MLRLRSVLIFAALAGVLTACTEPKPPGSVWVTYSTKLGDESPFNWQFTIDGASLQTVSSATTSSVRIDSLSAGPHRLVIAGLPPLCTTGSDDRTIEIPAGDTLRVSLGVVCTRLTGDIVLTIITTGAAVDRDPDGYSVLVDGVPNTTFASGASVTRTLAKLQPGTHAISLAGIASNCAVVGGPAFQSVVKAAEPTILNITVNCLSSSGTVRFTTTTSGGAALEDPSGYVVTIGTTATAIPVNGTASGPVPAGTYTATLSDIEPNCTATTTTKPVTVATGATTDLSFDVSCGAYAATTAALSATDPAADTLANTFNGTTKSFDVISLTTGYAPGFMVVTLKFNRAIGTDQLFGYIDFDVDENATTGVAPAVNSFGGSATQGVEGRLVFDMTPTPIAYIATTTGSTGLIRMIPGGDSIRFIVPFHRILNDDGNVTITSVIGPDDRPTDLVPNTGVLTSHRPGTVPVTSIVLPPPIDRGVRVALPAPHWKRFVIPSEARDLHFLD